jgi:nicotinamide-nucleotide amidase
LSAPIYSEIITVGDEILRGDVANGNATYIARALNAIGISTQRITVVADNLIEINAAIKSALDRTKIIIITGGLGPTPDDLTRDAVAKFFDMTVTEDPALLTHVQELFLARGMEMPETSRNQALFPVGARKIPNPHGTATGIHIERDNTYIFSLPGVPIEMQQMTDEYIVPFLHEQFPDAELPSRLLRLANIGESLVMKHLKDAGQELQDYVQIAFLPHHGLLDLRLSAKSSDHHEAVAQIAHAEGVLREMIGEHVYATDQSTLAAVIGRILVNRSQWLSAAESCTGGLVANLITDTPGSSRWFDRGFVTYSNQAKVEHLSVLEDALAEHGAVSETTAVAMAKGARERVNCEWGLATTGIAGPDGGTEEKPVGTVWIAVASSKKATARLLHYSGLRETIKLRAANSVLFLLYRELMDPA